MRIGMKRRAPASLFSTENLHTERMKELDLAKAFLIVCLAFIHVTIECTPEEGLASGIPYLFDSVIGGPMSAPMYMFSMGVGIAFFNALKHPSPAHYALRGIRLGLYGLLLNLCRFLLPFLAGYAISGDAGKYLAPLPYRVFGDDILQFACLALLVMALFQRLRLSNGLMLVISLGLSCLGTLLNGADLGTPAANILMGYFIGTEDAAGMVFSDFPLLNWLLFPVSGYVFGQYYLRVRDRRVFYALLSGVCAVVVLVYYPIGISRGWGMFGEGQNCYYHLRITDAFVCLATNLAILGLDYAITRKLPKRIMSAATVISKNINRVYCIHWVLVMWTTNVALYLARGTQYLSVPWTMLLSAMISAAAVWAARFWAERRKKDRREEIA